MNEQAARVLAVLERHIGVRSGIGAGDLAAATGISERWLRRIISQLREDGTAICGHPHTGYYIAATYAELEESCEFLRARALHSLALEARLRRIPLPELIGQLKLPT